MADLVIFTEKRTGILLSQVQRHWGTLTLIHRPYEAAAFFRQTDCLLK